MSKVGYKPIELPDTVNVEIQGRVVTVKGKEGQIVITLSPHLTLKKGDKVLNLERSGEDAYTRSLHGLNRSLISNAVIGVEKPWEKKLEVVGTGFNVKLQGEELVVKVGYSHPVVFAKQKGVKYAVQGNNKVTISGVDKQFVGQVAYQFKLIKKPDAYKGKGIKYEGEKLRIKPGKKAKTATAAA